MNNYQSTNYPTPPVVQQIPTNAPQNVQKVIAANNANVLAQQAQNIAQQNPTRTNINKAVNATQQAVQANASLAIQNENKPFPQPVPTNFNTGGAKRKTTKKRSTSKKGKGRK